MGARDTGMVPANTYSARVMGVTECGATPIFVEPDEYYNLDASRIQAAITPAPKAILVVHLYGQACNMQPIVQLAQAHGLFLVEDCAQSHGACCNGQITGTFVDVGCFSFYSTNNPGAFGYAGCITTNNPQPAEQIRMLRNFGSR